MFFQYFISSGANLPDEPKVYESTPEFASIDMGVMSAQECLQFENHIIEKLTFSEYYIEKHTIVSCSFGSYGP